MSTATQGLERAVPPGLEPERIVDFDYFVDPRFVSEGSVHNGLLKLQQEAPGIFWSTARGGYWVVQGHAETFEAARSPDLFSSARMAIPAMPEEEQRPKAIPINLDPPEHTPFRKPLNQAFSPKAMTALEGEIRALAIELIDAVADRGECDFIDAVGEPLPVLIFMRLMGMDVTRLHEFRDIVRRALSNPTDEVRMQAAMQVAGEMMALIKQRQAKREDDLVSRLLDTEVEGQPLSDMHMLGYCVLLFFAGLDTVANAMAFGIRHLAHDLPLQERLRANPSEVVKAAEELLRRYSVANPGRIVTRDTEWHGVRLRAGDRALLLLAGANLDSDAFPHAEKVDIDRENNAHIAFNAGPHRCIGAHLARIELRIMYEEWLARIPTFRPDPDKVEESHGAMVFGMDALPLVWDVKS